MTKGRLIPTEQDRSPWDKAMADTTSNTPGKKPQPFFHFVMADASQVNNVGMPWRLNYTLKPESHIVVSTTSQQDRTHKLRVSVSYNDGGDLKFRGNIEFTVTVHPGRSATWVIDALDKRYDHYVQGEPDWSEYIKNKPRELLDWLVGLVGATIYTPPPVVVPDPAEGMEWSVF